MYSDVQLLYIIDKYTLFCGLWCDAFEMGVAILCLPYIFRYPTVYYGVLLNQPCNRTMGHYVLHSGNNTALQSTMDFCKHPRSTNQASCDMWQLMWWQAAHTAHRQCILYPKK